MIRLEQLSKTYGRGADAQLVLDRLDFSVASGEIFAVVGTSGAGKSTLAQCVTLVERPTAGSVIVNDVDLTGLGEKHLRAARRRIGTIFQSDGLFSRRTAAENVALPLEILGVTRAESRRRVSELLDRVGLAGKERHYPHQLSGGQRQRVGIARALALRPSVLLSDEATSGLDPDSTRTIVALLKELRDELGLSILFITHEMDTVVQVADSVARLDHGRIVESGSVLDLIRDVDSPLGGLLRPRLESIQVPAGHDAWELGYSAAEVPTDWVGRLGLELGVPIALLGASVGTHGGAAIGGATIGIPAAASGGVARAAASLGLSARPVGHGALAHARISAQLEQVA
ncbi:methionine ABC transporter ATP-binding protein [Microbacterium sp. PMB16]|uniref:methionine ABC transporter ATP-binding protein n=1 Tax=Microbacterium sp. PMB16 TaxID=3120157 RepID=UPI003F4C8460